MHYILICVCEADECLKLCLPVHDLFIEGYMRNWLMVVVSRKETWE